MEPILTTPRVAQVVEMVEMVEMAAARGGCSSGDSLRDSGGSTRPFVIREIRAIRGGHLLFAGDKRKRSDRRLAVPNAGWLVPSADRPRDAAAASPLGALGVSVASLRLLGAERGKLPDGGFSGW